MSRANRFQFFLRFCFYESITSVLRDSRLNFHRNKIFDGKAKVRLSSGCESEDDWRLASLSYLLRVHARTIVLVDAMRGRSWQPGLRTVSRSFQLWPERVRQSWTTELSSYWSLRFEGLDRILPVRSTASVLTVELLNAWRLCKIDRERTYEGSM